METQKNLHDPYIRGRNHQHFLVETSQTLTWILNGGNFQIAIGINVSRLRLLTQILMVGFEAAMTPAVRSRC